MSKARTRKEKRITAQQIIGDQGVAMARKLIGDLGFVFYETGQVEAGIDGLMELRDHDGSVRAQFIGVQIKTKERGQYTGETAEAIEYLCKPDDFDYWSNSNLPVIVVLARLEDESVYWKEVDQAVVKGGVTSRRLIISKQEDRLEAGAISRIAQLAIDRSVPGTFLPAPRIAERHDLNLLAVQLPKIVYIAATECSRREDALDAMLARTEAPPLAWAIREGRMASFFDLSIPPLSEVADPGSVEEFAPEELIEDCNSEDYSLFLELIYRSLEQQLSDYFVHDRAEDIFYFPPDENVEYELEYASAIKKAKCWVVRKYPGKEKLTGYVRHRAFKPRFLLAGGQWFLSITPAWKFTRDGTREDPFSPSRIAWLKRQENNQSVRGQFFLWQCCLTDQAERFLGKATPQSLSFAKLEAFSSERAVPDKFWLSRDDNPPPIGATDGDDDTDD